MPGAVRVLLAGQDEIARDRLRRVLEEGGDEVVAEVDTEDGLLVALAGSRPDVLVLHLPHRPAREIATARLVHARCPDLPLLAFAASPDRATVLAAIDAGARGYVLSDDHPSQIVAAVHAAAEGASPISPRAATALVADRAKPLGEHLTRRERDVLSLLAEGLPNKEIAHRLAISERTVKAHLTSAFRRIGVRGRTQAALWVRDHGLPVIDLRNGQLGPKFDQSHIT